MKSNEQGGGGSVAGRIASSLMDEAHGVRVAYVRIGLAYTAVMLEDGGLGVAYTFRDEARGGCAVFQGMRPLRGRPASDLLALLESEDPIEAGVGLACANAMTNRDGAGFLAGDVLDHIDLRPGDHVGMVGHFGPLVEEIRRRTSSLTVFERVERASGLLRPANEAPETLPRCQVALVTATSIINHTMDGLLEAAEGCREVTVLGASTPLLPGAFAGRRTTMLSGVVVKDPLEILRVVSEGGGMRQFGPYIQKVSIKTVHDKPVTERSTT
jgi:uncharacterized protein (DUF4213/DUF364 family)